MFRWLRTGNPYNALFLLIYALVIKYFFLAHPVAAVAEPAIDGWLYPYLVSFLRHQAGFGPLGFSLFAFVLLFIEALLLNGIVNRFRIIPGTSYFPAFCFLLFSSYFRVWNRFSSPLLALLFLLAVLAQMFRLYSAEQSRSRSFTIGFILGTASLFYLPALALLPLVWITLLITRPFRLAEWILAVAGAICPYYFLGTVLFLAGHLSLLKSVPFFFLSYPVLHGAYVLSAGMAILIWWFLFGSMRLQQDYMKMMIQMRKCWQVLLAFLCVSLVLPFLPNIFSISGWMIAFMPLAVFIALGFWHIRKGWVAALVHLTALAYVFLVQWVY